MAEPLRPNPLVTADHKQLYELLVSELTDFAVFLTDPEGRITSWNPGVGRLLSYTEDEWLGLPFHSIFTAEDRAAKRPEDEMAKATREGRSPDVRWHQRKDGSRLFVDGTLVALRDASGTLLGFSKVMRDITQRQQHEIMLSEKARLAVLGTDVGAALARIAVFPKALQRCAEAIVEHLDAAFARIWILAPEADVLELRASAGLYTHLDGSHSRVPVGSFKIGQIALERRPHLTNDVLNDPRVGDPDWAAREGMVAFAGYPLMIENRLVGVLGLFARHALGPDILIALESVAVSIAVGIVRSQAEAERERLVGELARSNDELLRFAHIAAHDLQSPLRMVTSYTQLLERRLRGQLDESGRAFMTYVLDGTARMGHLIDSLLRYAQVGTDGPAHVAVSMEAITSQAVDNLELLIRENDAKVEYASLPTVLGNEILLLQLIQNLLANGIKYRRPDVAPQISVFAEKTDGFWTFAVRDNGQGISPQYQTQIFELLKRLHGDEIPGTGMGLALCKKVVARHGGRIWVESEAGKGSTFYFTLKREP